MMKVTERDMQIMGFINEFGFCEMPQLEKRFNLKKPRCYQVVKRLIDAGLITHQRIFHARHGAIYLTKQRAKYTDLPAIRGISKDNYNHQLKIIDVYLFVKERFPSSNWIGERRIKHEKLMEGLGKHGLHLPDGVLEFRSLQKIAIEVELTMKSKERLEEIIVGYALRKNVKEVWYFCPSKVIERVQKVAGTWKHIRVCNLSLA